MVGFGGGPPAFLRGCEGMDKRPATPWCHINSIWLNSDSQSFLSADDLRINLWHPRRHQTPVSPQEVGPSGLGALNPDELAS